MKKGSPRDLLYVGIKLQILIKDNSKIPDSGSRDQGNAI